MFLWIPLWWFFYFFQSQVRNKSKIKISKFWKKVVSILKMFSGWWQLKYFLCSPLFGEDEPILTIIFFKGCGFNHQPVLILKMFLFESSLTVDKKIQNCCTKEMVIRVNLKDVHTNSSYKLLPKSDGGNNMFKFKGFHFLLSGQISFGDLWWIFSKKSPTGPTERTPKPEYLIARSQLPSRGPLVRSHSIFDGILEIRLMDKILHHLGWLKPYK